MTAEPRHVTGGVDTHADAHALPPWIPLRAGPSVSSPSPLPQRDTRGFSPGCGADRTVIIAIGLRRYTADRLAEQLNDLLNNP